MSSIAKQNVFSRQPEIHTLVTNFDVTFAKPLDNIIANYLIKSGNVGKTRGEISESVKAPRSSVYDSINRMIISGLIERDYKTNKTKIGRPNTVYFVKYKKQGKRR